MSRGRWAALATWGAGLLLLLWALRHVSWPELWALLRGLSPLALAALLALNILILLLLTARWRVFVQGIAPQIPFSALFKARMAAFSLSYFTPGPQFGGEPLQVVALHQRGVAAATATATVALDKLVELLTNFSVLALGVLTLWLVGLGDSAARVWAALLAAGLLALPLGYLLLLGRGHHPFARVLQALAGRRPPGRLQHGLSMLAHSERLAGEMARSHPRQFLAALVWAILAWGLMLLEFGLSARLLGAPLSPLEAIAALAAARFAFLLPMPGGLGALSSSLILAFAAMGYDPNAALALTIYIRTRDLIIGLMGAWWAGHLLRPRSH